MSDTPQYLALRKVSQMPITVQRMQDKITLAKAMPGMDAGASTKLTEASTALETAQGKIVDAIGLQAEAG